MRKISLLLVCLFSHLFINAQVRKISINDGLSDYNVTDIIQDSQGYLWIATMDGLNRYDGYTITSFKNNPDNPHSLYKNRSTCLCEDALGNIWTGNRRGISIFNPQRDQFYNIEIEAVSCIVNGNDGDVYIGTISGNIFKTNCRFIDYNTSQPAINITWQKRVNYFATAMIVVDDKLIVGTKNAGVYIFGEKFSIASKVDGLEDLSQLGRIRKLYRDTKQRIWCLSDKGTFLIEEHDNKFVLKSTKYNRLGIFRQIVEYSPDTFIVVVDNRRVERVHYDNAQFKLIERLESLKSNSNCLMKDRSNGLWLGTLEEGLVNYQIDGMAFKSIDFSQLNLESEWVTAMYEDRSGHLWFAIRNYSPTRETTVIRIDQSLRIKNIFTRNNSSFKTVLITSIYQDEQGNMWFTSQGILYLLSRENQVNKSFKLDVIKTAPKGTQYSQSICNDINGNLWLGTWNGVIYSNMSEGKAFLDDYIYFYENSMEHNGISSSETTRGRVLMQMYYTVI